MILRAEFVDEQEKVVLSRKAIYPEEGFRFGVKTSRPLMMVITQRSHHEL
jgi:hypothetical protein